jgi:hypothetical protein
MIACSDGDRSNQATPVVWYTFVLNAAWRHVQVIRKPKGRSLSQWPYFGFTVFLDEGRCPRPPNFCTLSQRPCIKLLRGTTARLVVWGLVPSAI